MKITNANVFSLINNRNQSSGLLKLMNHGNLDWEKAYLLSCLVPELEKQYWIIIENRNRLSLKYFPADENGKQSILEKTHTGYVKADWTQASEDEIKEFEEKTNEFTSEFNAILEKEVEISGEKIQLSLQKDEKWLSELGKLNLTATDLIILKPLISVV